MEYKNKDVISVIGLGYVGLPVAAAFSRKFKTIGYDINSNRISELKTGLDRTRELSKSELLESPIRYTTELKAMIDSDFFIVTVPTPIDRTNRPDLKYLRSACHAVGKVLSQSSRDKVPVIVFESTVYPGCTEEDCVPFIEEASGLKCGTHFKVGYSPERINPGDKERTLTKIKKIVSAQDIESLKRVTFAYGEIIEAGLHMASSIKVAEAAKVIENTQRDLNVALVNELAVIFHKLNINTVEVLEAAGTKWNFLPFRPGLVGGHCIGVDPYYLTHKAEMVGYLPQVILAGRRLNDEMGRYIAQQTIKQMIKQGSPILGAKVNILGLTFKENCTDIRNTKVVDIINELKSFGVKVFVADPHAINEEVHEEYGLNINPISGLPKADAVVLAVAHDEYKKMNSREIRGLLHDNRNLIIDIKSIMKNSAHRQEFTVWSC